MASFNQSEVVDVDPSGDVIFIVGTSQSATTATIRVSSELLSLASSVFAALFSPRFAESIALVESTETRQISLPDDDPEAMLVVCRTLHFVENTVDDISYPLLEKVAEVCDKYDVGFALRGWSELALQKWKMGMDDNDDRCAQLLNISFILGSQETFWLASRNLMLHCSVATPPTDRENGLAFAGFVEDLLGKLQLTDQQ